MSVGEKAVLLVLWVNVVCPHCCVLWCCLVLLFSCLAMHPDRSRCKGRSDVCTASLVPDAGGETLADQPPCCCQLKCISLYFRWLLPVGLVARVLAGYVHHPAKCQIPVLRSGNDAYIPTHGHQLLTFFLEHVIFIVMLWNQRSRRPSVHFLCIMMKTDMKLVDVVLGVNGGRKRVWDKWYNMLLFLTAIQVKLRQPYRLHPSGNEGRFGLE